MKLKLKGKTKPDDIDQQMVNMVNWDHQTSTTTNFIGYNQLYPSSSISSTTWTYTPNTTYERIVTTNPNWQNYIENPNWQNYIGTDIVTDTVTFPINYYSYIDPVYDKFECYSSSEYRIDEGKKRFIFSLFKRNNMRSLDFMDYDALVKHLGIEEILLNTLVLEYVLKNMVGRYMVLLSTYPHYTKYQLFDLLRD